MQVEEERRGFLEKKRLLSEGRAILAQEKKAMLDALSVEQARAEGRTCEREREGRTMRRGHQECTNADVCTLTAAAPPRRGAGATT